MRHRAVVVALVLGVFGLAVSGAEKPPENYQKAMKDLGAFAQGIGKAISDQDYDAVSKYAASAEAAFVVAGAFWTTKGDADAAKTAQTGEKAAGDLAVVAGLKSAEGAAYSAKGVTDVCAGCHAAHRETMPDGSFQIK
jgi:hypothetical protein